MKVTEDVGLRRDFHRHAVVAHGEAVRQVVDVVEVRNVDGHLSPSRTVNFSRLNAGALDVM